jgi:Vitamin B6 photo-protection and homoeostasis
MTARMGGMFDSDSKMYRLASDVLFDVGISLELVTPLFPGSFLVLAAAGNFIKSVSTTMGIACRNSVLATFVLRENLGEISSKNDAQNTVANLIGLALGIGAARVLPEAASVRLAVFWALTSVYSLLNYKSMKVVTLRTLNRQRAGIAIDAFLAGAPVPPPSYANLHERIIPGLRPRFADPALRLGAPLSALEDGLDAQISAARRAKDRYIMDISPRSVDVVLHRGVKQADLLEAFLAYMHLRRGLRGALDGGRCRGVGMFDERRRGCVPTARRVWAEIDPATRYRLLSASRAYARKNVRRLRTELEDAGYSTSTLLFSPNRLRAVY